MIKPRNENPQGMQRTPSSQVISDVSLSQFLWFIQERESIRVKKEAGEKRPWTTDEILDKTRFTNIFRQSDKVSKFIFERVSKLDGEELVYNLLVSRLINRIDALSKVLPNGDLSILLEGDAVFMNAAAYQVSPGLAKMAGYTTNREAIVYHPKKVSEKVYRAITSTDSIKEAVLRGNEAFGGCVNFVMFQVVLDYHYLTNFYDENSDIPIGQGAIGVLEQLPPMEELKKITGMKSWDIEHAACEYRKYLHRQGKVLSRYSYKPNSMGI